MGKRLVCGAGVNDAEYDVCIYSNYRENGKYKQKMVWICPYYRKWQGVIIRCFDSKFKNKYPSYGDCTVDTDWLVFSNFRSWMEAQNWEGNHLDKDILVEGNKHYSPHTCIFVDQLTNSFLNSGAHRDSSTLMGVKFSLKSNKTNPYQAQCSNPFTGKVEYIGCFPTEIEAHLAWKAKKHEHACKLADMQSNTVVADILRVRYKHESIL